MRHREPVPEIPPVPVRRAGRDAPDTRPTPARVPQQPQREQPALPDLLEAFWGDGAEARAAEADAERPASSRKRSQRRNVAATRSKTASDV